MSEGGANNCCIELIHGGFVHVQHSPDEIEHACVMAIQARQPFITLTRMEGFEAREARGFPEVKINPKQIIGIFPLRSHSQRIVRSEL